MKFHFILNVITGETFYRHIMNAHQKMVDFSKANLFLQNIKAEGVFNSVRGLGVWKIYVWKIT